MVLQTGIVVYTVAAAAPTIIPACAAAMPMPMPMPIEEPLHSKVNTRLAVAL